MAGINEQVQESDEKDFMSSFVPVFSVRKNIRVKKEDSAFVYFILESYEGITSYSTLDFNVGDLHRDLELRTPPDFVEEVDALLTQLGELVYEIKQ